MNKDSDELMISATAKVSRFIMIEGKDSMSADRSAKFATDIGGFSFYGHRATSTRSSIGKLYEKWIKEARLDIRTGP